MKPEFDDANFHFSAAVADGTSGSDVAALMIANQRKMQEEGVSRMESSTTEMLHLRNQGVLSSFFICDWAILVWHYRTVWSDI